MKKFIYLEHTADIAFVGYGATLKTAVENSASALLNVMLDTKEMENDRAAEAALKIKESANTKEDLVWFTLQDILSKIDEKKLNATKFTITKISENPERVKLEGNLFYKKTKTDYALLSVKAVTPHELKVSKENGIYYVHVVVDV